VTYTGSSTIALIKISWDVVNSYMTSIGYKDPMVRVMSEIIPGGYDS
jgi:hypothetical protein